MRGTWFQIWSGESGNVSEEFASEDAALAEIRRRVRTYGHSSVCPLALVGLDTAGEVGEVIEGAQLIQRADNVIVLEGRRE